MSWQDPRSCIMCGAEYTPNGPKQKVCSDECRRQRGLDRVAARKRGEYIEGPQEKLGEHRAQRFAGGPMKTPVAGAIADVLIHLNKAGTLPGLDLPGLGAVVRNVVVGIRSKDRAVYEDSLKELALWAILNLSRVRSSDEDRA